GLAVAGVLVYNRLQERSARRRAERAFGAPHSDVLMGDGRREPTLGTEPELQRRAAHGVRAPSPNSAPNPAAPDPRIDYIVELSIPEGASTGLAVGWRGVAQRFGRRALLSRAEAGRWHAALQLVSRSGVVAEAELVEFRSAIETLSAQLRGSAAAPGMREALHAARELDGACAEADIQVALHVVGVPPQQDFAGQPFQAAPRVDGVTLTLDVPRTADPERGYDAMARAGLALARAQGGRLVDDQGHELDERALAAIRAQLELVRKLLAGRGIEPGGPLALRLFS
ncbi:MAG TPA: cell division protein ZipA C-terminal FtsZ-binding domain-containing protein, partial [Burkholderiales bacterium]|nr:cell division protein ZipA C-terminal FtsZ-binding domain-containing protein [Burkholderiales bacterium]